MFSQDIGGEKIRPCESTSSPSTANVDNNPTPLPPSSYNLAPMRKAQRPCRRQLPRCEHKQRIGACQ